jgi:xanthine dehydrogenase iron-sulfur cluster and FAD-binding subunit A
MSVYCVNGADCLQAGSRQTGKQQTERYTAHDLLIFINHIHHLCNILNHTAPCVVGAVITLAFWTLCGQ